MNFVKKILAISFIGLSMQAFAEPIALEFSDKTVNYDSEDLKDGQEPDHRAGDHRLPSLEWVLLGSSAQQRKKSTTSID